MMHCMTARKIKQFKLRSCQISEGWQDVSDLIRNFHGELGNTAGNSAPVPTEHMPSKPGSGDFTQVSDHGDR